MPSGCFVARIARECRASANYQVAFRSGGRAALTGRESEAWASAA